MDSFFSRFSLCAFAVSAIPSPGDEEVIASVVAAPFAVTLTMCVTVKANALNIERGMSSRGRDVRANLRWTGFVRYVASAPVGDKDNEDLGKHRTCHDVGMWTSSQGYPRRSKETFMDLTVTCRFSSCLPGGALLNTAYPSVYLNWMRRW